jgi:hypothetical protein
MVLNIHGQDSVVGYCAHGNEPLDPINSDVYTDQLSDYQLLKKKTRLWFAELILRLKW